MKDQEFVDTNQQKVCKKCGHRWHASVPDPGCAKCNVANKLGGQLNIPEEPKKKESAPKQAPKAKTESSKKDDSDKGDSKTSKS